MTTLTADQRMDMLADLGVTQGVQTVTISGGPTGGTFTLTYEGQTTTPLAWNALGTAVQTALSLLSTIGADNVSVSGNGPYVVTFQGALAGQTASVLTADSSGLTGGTTPSIAVSLVTVFSSAEMDRLFDRANGDYDVMIVLALRQLRVQAARFFNYTIGQSTIDRKQIFDNLGTVLAEKERIAGLDGQALSTGTISTGIDYPDVSHFDEFWSDPRLWSGL